MTRKNDWPLHFEAFAAARRSLPFVWGTNDCATFAADCVLALTGTDPAPAGLRKHRTERQALRALQRHGGLAAIATRALGAPVSASLAGVGDVVLVRVGARFALGICNGDTVLGPSAVGMAAVGMAGAAFCWKVD